MFKTFPLQNPQSKIQNVQIRNPHSLAQTDHIVSTVYVVVVCKKGSYAILKSAPGQAKIQNGMNPRHPDP
jgi:hypothetical protein